MYAAADPDLRIRGERSPKKHFFRPLGPKFGLKISGSPGPPIPSPGSATGMNYSLAMTNNSSVC